MKTLKQLASGLKCIWSIAVSSMDAPNRSSYLDAGYEVNSGIPNIRDLDGLLQWILQMLLHS